MLCDTTCYAINLNTVQTAFLTHFFGHNAEKVTNTHSRLKDIAAAEAKRFKTFVNRIYNRRRGIMCVQHRTFGGGVFVLRQRFHKLLVFSSPRAVVLVKCL